MKKDKKKKIIISISIVLIILILIGILIKVLNKKETKENNNIDNINDSIVENDIIEDKYIEIDENKIEEEATIKDSEVIENLKQEESITGDSNIYEVQEEYDGRKVLAVKAGIKYKVAFAGMIKKSIPKLDEINTIFNEKLPKKCGIWLEENSRSRILKLINNFDNVNSEYYVNDEGYLKIKEKKNQTEIDKKLSDIINGNKQYILSISSVCYIVDEVTGEFLDYNFENMDSYQSYEYFNDNDKAIIFITENKKKQLTDNEIIKSVIDLIIQL